MNEHPIYNVGDIVSVKYGNLKFNAEIAKVSGIGCDVIPAVGVILDHRNFRDTGQHWTPYKFISLVSKKQHFDDDLFDI